MIQQLETRLRVPDAKGDRKNRKRMAMHPYDTGWTRFGEERTMIGSPVLEAFPTARYSRTLGRMILLLGQEQGTKPMSAHMLEARRFRGTRSR